MANSKGLTLVGLHFKMALKCAMLKLKCVLYILQHQIFHHQE